MEKPEVLLAQADPNVVLNIWDSLPCKHHHGFGKELKSGLEMSCG
jgi:hypothetical protein